MNVDPNELRINLTLRRKTDGYTVTLELPFETFYHVYKAINEKSIGPEAAQALIEFGSGIARGGPVPPEDRTTIHVLVSELQRQEIVPDELWETDEDPILSFSYHMLRDRQITYKEAAELAARLLNQRIDPNTWKQRVRRWAERHNKPKVGLRQRGQNVTNTGQDVTNSAEIVTNEHQM